MDPLVNMRVLGEQVLLRRRRAGLSQAELAQCAGVDPMTISRIESGQKKRLELETAARLARVFGVTLDQFCGLEPAADNESAAAPTTRSGSTESASKRTTCASDLTTKSLIPCERSRRNVEAGAHLSDADRRKTSRAKRGPSGGRCRPLPGGIWSEDS